MPRQRHVRRHSVAKCCFTGYPPKPRASGYWFLYSLELRSRPLLSPTARNLQPLGCLWSKTDNVKAIFSESYPTRKSPLFEENDMEHKDFIKKCDVNTINRIIDEHHKLWKRQRFIRLVVLFSITALYPLIGYFLINNNASFFYIFIIAFSLALLVNIVIFIDIVARIIPTPLSDQMIIDRETIQFLIVLTSYYPDVQQKLFNRLLSGKKLTLRDEQEIENLCLLKRYSNSN